MADTLCDANSTMAANDDGDVEVLKRADGVAEEGSSCSSVGGRFNFSPDVRRNSRHVNDEELRAQVGAAAEKVSSPAAVEEPEKGADEEAAVAGGQQVLSPLSGAYLLVILGEPLSEEHKGKMVEKLRKGNCRLHLRLCYWRL